MANKKGKIIAIANHKGGVGKTTSTINLGAALNKLGKKVLIVDFDPQANLSTSLGVSESEHDIYNSLINSQKLVPVKIIENFDLIPATIDLSGAEIELISEPGREFILSGLLEPLRANYDYIIIDCAPSLALLTLNALTAADEVLIPLQAEYLATQGLTKLMDIVNKIKIRRLNKKLIVGGIFITQFDSRKTLNRDVIEFVKENFDSYIFESKIRDNVTLAEAPSVNLDIFRYNENSNGAKDYLALAEEILTKN